MNLSGEPIRSNNHVVSRSLLNVIVRRLTGTAYSSGIFGYVNYLVEKDRKYILDTLVNGLSR